MRRLSASLFMFLAILLALPVLAAARDGLFAPPVNYGVGEHPYCVAVGDLNGDSAQDLATANLFGGDVSVLLGYGDGTFQPAVDYGVGDYPRFLAVGDLDGDGDQDIAVANYYSNDVSVLLGNGDGTFQTSVNYDSGEGPHSVAIADLDGDGDQDLAVVNYTTQNVSVFLGNGDGTFQRAVGYGVGAYPRCVAIGDLDGDGDQDLAVANHYSSDVSVLAGNGDGTFQAPVHYGVGTGPYYVATDDLDSDGIPDLVAAGSDDNKISVLMGNGDGTFQASVHYGAGSFPLSVDIGDLDGDGNKDLVAANLYIDRMSVLLGNGDGSFQPYDYYVVGDNPYSVAMGDLDGDSNLDVVTANSYGDDVSVLLNLTGPSLPPEPWITGVTDAGNDQGRQVRIVWHRSLYDAPGNAIDITGYGIYRHQNEYLLERGQPVVQSTDPTPMGEGARLEGWDYIATVPARGDSFYQYVAPTLCDSTEQHGICWSVFFVSAMTPDPLVYFDSVPDSGYSIDNLAPEPPLTVSGRLEPQTGYINLSWSPSSSIDLQYYELHRGGGPDFVPGIDSRVYTDIDTFYVDDSLLWNESTYYKVAAVDFGGNKSEYASLSVLETGVFAEEVPALLAFHPPTPNPFTSATTLAYDLSEPGRVSLYVYDAAGRRVRILLESVMHEAGRHTVTWDGRDDEGRSTASGVYFCRVEAGGRALMKRVVLLR